MLYAIGTENPQTARCCVTCTPRHQDDDDDNDHHDHDNCGNRDDQDHEDHHDRDDHHDDHHDDHDDHDGERKAPLSETIPRYIGGVSESNVDDPQKPHKVCSPARSFQGCAGLWHLWH